ncbi:hypothetical protein BKA62DRAFT_461675 [Auriculariales sp. MPI-PUGE-AT-0066]|nr:hypothetical protein BKA62DRAFT_461675 [Auriculariales sp. MPI-PUGE-AT-0066]
MEFRPAESDMRMDEDAPMAFDNEHDSAPQPLTFATNGTSEQEYNPFQTMHSIQLPNITEVSTSSAAATVSSQSHPHAITQAGLRNLAVKVHIRKSGRVAWKYVGRAHVQQEFQSNGSSVVIRSVSSGKVITTFSETSDIQADKRGNFIVVACVESSGVTSWSLNAVNNSDAVKLLTCIELACYCSKSAMLETHKYNKSRRRIEKVVREDRRRRHNSKKEEDDLAAAFGSQQIAPEGAASAISSPFAAATTSPPATSNFLRAYNPSTLVAQ